MGTLSQVIHILFLAGHHAAFSRKSSSARRQAFPIDAASNIGFRCGYCMLNSTVALGQ